jgi:hypothetical protein
MPKALRIFLWSLFAAFVGGTIAFRASFWLVEKFFPHAPYAPGFALLATLGVGIASAVTAGVVMGKNDR